MGKTKGKSLKFWINIITFGALALLVVLSWEQIQDAFRDLASLNTGYLFLIIPIQAFGYYATARLYKDFFDARGDRLGIKNMYKIVLELNFVNHVFPSGGVSGFSYLSLRMKELGISTSKSTLAQILRFALTFLSFVILLLFGLLMLSLEKETSPFLVLVSSTIIFGTIAGAGVGVYIIGKPSRIKAFVGWLPKAVNSVSRYFKRGSDLINIAKVEDTLEELHKDYKDLMRDKKLIRWLMVWALLLNISEVLTIFIVYLAFGSAVNPGAVIIAYAVANFAGLVAILPGGVGIYEGLMTAVMTSTGVSRGLALSATVVFRVLTMAISLPIGYFYYNKAVSKIGKENIKHGAS